MGWGPGASEGAKKWGKWGSAGSFRTGAVREGGEGTDRKEVVTEVKKKKVGGLGQIMRGPW